jgi:hypothetical protein
VLLALLLGPAVKVQTPDSPPEGLASRSSSNPPYEDGLEIAQGGGEAPASVAEAVGLVSITQTSGSHGSPSNAVLKFLTSDSSKKTFDVTQSQGESIWKFSEYLKDSVSNIFTDVISHLFPTVFTLKIQKAKNICSCLASCKRVQ